MSTRTRSRTLQPAPLLVALLLSALTASSPAHAAGLKVGDRAAGIALVGVDGRRVTLGVGKRVVVVAFVRLGAGDKASTNSEKVLRELERFKKALPPGAACDIAAVLSSGQALAKSLRLTYPTLVDSKDDAYGAYGVRVHPYTFVIGKGGQIVETIALCPGSFSRRLKASVWAQLGLKVEPKKPRQTADRRGKRQVNLARILLKRGDAKGAMETIAPFLSLEPAVEVAHVLAGEIQLKEGDLAQAKLHFEEVLKRTPRRWEAKLGLARCELRSGALDAAQRALEALLRRCPKPSRVHYALGELWTARGDEGRAAKEFRLAYEKVVVGR